MSQGQIKSAFEPDEIRIPVPGLHLQVTVNERASYAATAAALQLDRLWLAFAEDNAAHTVRVQMPADLMTFALLPGAQPAVLAGGVPFKRHQLNQHCPGRDYHQTTEGPSLTGSIMLAPEALCGFAAAMGATLPTTNVNQLIEPSVYALQRLLRLHLSAMRLVRETPDLISRAEAMRGLENAVLDALLGCVSGAAAEPSTAAQRNHQDIIRKFDDVLAAHDTSSLYMGDVAAMIGVSARSLRACCQEHLGMGPKYFLMLRRLHMVRRRLINGTTDTVSVTDAATEFGFWELGRFSVAYREAFDESPSATLRREPRDGRPAMSWSSAASGFGSAGNAWAGSRWAAALSWIGDMERNVGLQHGI